MALRIGYLLPTREQIMAGEPRAAPLLALAERAEGLGCTDTAKTLPDGLAQGTRRTMAHRS